MVVCKTRENSKDFFTDTRSLQGLQKYLYHNLRLACRQSVFLVEVSLHDDAAVPVLSRAKILWRALVSVRTARHVESISMCEDWRVVNAMELIKVCIFIGLVAAAETAKDF